MSTTSHHPSLPTIFYSYSSCPPFLSSLSLVLAVYIAVYHTGVRAGKRLALKRTIDQALEKGGHAVTRVIVASRTDTQVPMTVSP